MTLQDDMQLVMIDMMVVSLKARRTEARGYPSNTAMQFEVDLSTAQIVALEIEKHKLETSML